MAMQELANIAVVHRDIKPSNILWHENRWRLADFGISRIMTAATATHTFQGTATLAYLAPESWGFGPQTVSSDLYALGCTGYEALTGRAAFDGADLYREHATHIPVLPEDTDPVLARVINQLLAKNPDHRPADARKVLELLTPREGLTSGQRTLQQLSAAAAARTLQRGSHESALVEHHTRQERARSALSTLWGELVDHVREAVPDAESTEDVDNLVDSRTLTVADTRLRCRLEESPRSQPGEVLHITELYVNSASDLHPRLAANLVCFWSNGRPEWHLAQFRWEPTAGSNLPANAIDRPSGLPAAAAYDPWETPGAEGVATIVLDVPADPNAIVELIARELRSSA
jgi:serine/threonine protein kinase